MKSHTAGPSQPHQKDVISMPYAWLALICGLADLEIPIEEPHPRSGRHLEDTAVGATERVIDEVKSHLSPYWACLR